MSYHLGNNGSSATAPSPDAAGTAPAPEAAAAASQIARSVYESARWYKVDSSVRSWLRSRFGSNVAIQSNIVRASENELVFIGYAASGGRLLFETADGRGSIQGSFSDPPQAPQLIYADVQSVFNPTPSGGPVTKARQPAPEGNTKKIALYVGLGVGIPLAAYLGYLLLRPKPAPVQANGRRTSRGARLRSNAGRGGASVAKFKALFDEYKKLEPTQQQIDDATGATSLMDAKRGVIAEKIGAMNSTNVQMARFALSRMLDDRLMRERMSAADSGIDPDSAYVIAKMSREVGHLLERAETNQAVCDDVIYQVAKGPRVVAYLKQYDPEVSRAIVLLLRSFVLAQEESDLLDSVDTLADIIGAALSEIAGILDPSPIIGFTDARTETPDKVYKRLTETLAATKLLHAALLRRITRAVGAGVVQANRRRTSRSRGMRPNDRRWDMEQYYHSAHGAALVRSRRALARQDAAYRMLDELTAPVTDSRGVTHMQGPADRRAAYDLVREAYPDVDL